MMCYKDTTYCPGPCDNKECFRHASHVEEARQEGGFLHQNPWMPICWFVEKPKDCNAINT